MARIRTIKPEFWRHERLSELPEATHMLAAALLNYADDEGYFNANLRLVQAECFPLREPSVSIHDSLIALSAIGYLELGQGADGRRYGRIVHFEEHQRVNRPVASKIKNIDIVWEVAPQPHAQLSEPSSPEGKGKEQGREGNNAPSQASGAVPDNPPPEDKARYSEEFEALWSAYRPIAAKNATKADAATAFNRLGRTDREACTEGTRRYAEWLLAERRKRPDTPAKHLATFIHKRGWEPFLDEAESSAPAVNGTTWITEDDPRWEAVAARYGAERGKPLHASGSQRRPGQGADVPSDWLVPH